MGYIQCNDCKKEVERTASEINKYKPYCRKCSYKHRKRLKVGRTPNTMCELCKKPLYRRPWQLKSHTYISCIKCKPIVQSKHPENWKKIATINYGYRFKKGDIPSKKTIQMAILAKKKIPAWNKGLTRKDNPNIVAYWLGKKRPDLSIKLTGRKLSNETKKKISNFQIKNPRSKEYYKKIGLTGARVLYLRQPTSIEKKLYEELKKLGLLFETQKLINGRFVVDAYIPSLNLVIEADGNYWHNLPKIKGKDKAENAYLTKCGYNLLRLSETEINNTNFGERIRVEN